MKTVKAFITVDQFIDNASKAVSPIYELSDYAYTYSTDKKQYYYSQDPSYLLYLFNTKTTSSLTQEEVDNIVLTVKYLNSFLTQNITFDKQVLTSQVMEYLNVTLSNDTISSIDYSDLISTPTAKAPDYITFTTQNLQVSVWCNYQKFELFYPDYEILDVLPIDNLKDIIGNTNQMVQALNSFDITQFNAKIQSYVNKTPPTTIRIINIPYVIASTGSSVNCYFGFIIYGAQGNFDYILKLQLYDYLKNNLGIQESLITTYFPSILNINEFFIVPRWDNVAIPSQVGQISIGSQVLLSYSQPFDTNRFITVYTDNVYLRDNTYNVPLDYNNLIAQVTNGYYTETNYKDFKQYYSDLITVASTNMDFARMSSLTQRFVVLLESMLAIADSSNEVEFMNKIMMNTDYKFSVIIRSGISYLTCFFDKHQYYVLPRYVMANILNPTP
jgi:hypothetical protein